MADEEVVSQQVDDGKQVEETNNNTNEEVKEEPSAAIAPDVDSAAVDGEMECDEDCDSDNLVPESAFWHVSIIHSVTKRDDNRLSTVEPCGPSFAFVCERLRFCDCLLLHLLLFAKAAPLHLLVCLAYPSS